MDSSSGCVPHLWCLSYIVDQSTWQISISSYCFSLSLFHFSLFFFKLDFTAILYTCICVCVCIYREFRNMFNQPVHTIRVPSLLLHSSFSFEPREKETYHLTSINNYRLGSSTSFPSLLTKEKQKIMIETD